MAKKSPLPDVLLDDLAAEAKSQGLVLDMEGKLPPRGKAGPAIEDDDWLPPLTPKGEELWYSDLKYLLAHGERGSSKTVAALHKCIKHAYENDGARVCIATKLRSGSTLGGAWTKLIDIVLPQWVDGYKNWNGEEWPGFGLEGDGPKGAIVQKMDDSRNRFFLIKNQYGGWSKVFMLSLQHGEQIDTKIRTIEFTAYFYDELTQVDHEDYFIKPIQQLYRMSGDFPRFFLAACNPPEEGEDHWVYKRFFIGFDAPKTPTNPRPKKSSEYMTLHFPMGENNFIEPELKADLIASVYEEARNDPTAEDRLIKGLWRKKPTGRGIFREYWNRDRHVAGSYDQKEPKRAKLLCPDPLRRTLEIGLDFGSANLAASFGQKMMTGQGEGWIIFDEIILTGRHVPLQDFGPMLLDHMNSWCLRCRTPFHFNVIGDAAAFNTQNSDGSYDARVLEQVVTKLLWAMPPPGQTLDGTKTGRWPALQHMIERDPRGQPIWVNFRIAACPKPPGSVAARIKMMAARMQLSLLLVSAKCIKIIEMFESLEHAPFEVFEPKKGSPHKHPFDAASYPVYHHEMGGKTFGVLSKETGATLVEVG